MTEKRKSTKQNNVFLSDTDLKLTKAAMMALDMIEMNLMKQLHCCL
jgi:hypothetical protein